VRGLPQTLILLCTLGPLGAAGAQDAAPDAAEEAEFPGEKSGTIGEAYFGLGFDTNANNGADSERYFFLDLAPEERDSETPYLATGASLMGSKALGERLAWRNAVGVSLSSYPSAHFTDTQDASVQSQLRWSGRRLRVSAGGVYSTRWFAGNRSDEVVAAGIKLEALARALLFSVSGEGARVRYPDLPERDVETRFVRAEVTPAPREDAVLVPRAAVMAGREDAQQEDSPFGRDLWGGVLGVTRRLTERSKLDFEVGYVQSEFDETSLAAQGRADDAATAKLYLHWKAEPKAPVEHSFGLRFRTNRSTEPLYQFDRFVIGYEIAGTWGKVEE
jgi:hypothetical protein